MNATLQTLFKYITDPCDLADSVSAFLQSRSELFRPTVEALSGVIDGSITSSEFKSNENIYHKWATSVVADDISYFNLDEIVDLIDSAIDSSDGDPLANVYDINGEVTGSVPLTEVLDRMHNLIGENEMLITSLNIAQQIADGDTQDFLTNSFAKIEGYLQGSDLAMRLKGIFTSIYEEIRENVQEPTYLVESLLTHFGMIGDNADPRKNDASDYTGQSSICTLMMDSANKVGWAIIHLPDALRYTLGFIALLGDCVVKLFEITYKGIQKITYKVINRVLELGDAVQKTLIPGRGYLAHPGFGVCFDNQHDWFPTGAGFAAVYNQLSNAIGASNTEPQQYTVPFGPIVLYIDWQVTKVQLTYDIKPLDYKLYKQVYYEHFNEYPYLSVQSTGGSIFADSSGASLSGKARNDLLSFIQDLYSRNNLWGLNYDTDSDRYMCVQASKHLCSIIYALSKTTDAIIDSTLASECTSACIYIDITKEHGYRAQTQSFIPENYNFASLCTMIGTRSGRVDCFYGYLNDNNILDFTDDSIVQMITAVNCEFMTLLGDMASNVIGTDPLASINYFVPYFHKFKLYRPSYYIQTDSENLANVKRMIVTGIIVTAVIAVVAICVYLGFKFKKKKWMLEQQAAQKAFTASETGNAALLQEGWKLQKRVNLLGILSGSAEAAVTPITSGITTAIQSIKGDSSSGVITDTSLYEIKNLIK